MKKTFKGAGIVWRRGKMVARFVDGLYATEDKETIKILEEMGYLCIDDGAPKEETTAVLEETAIEPVKKNSRSRKTTVTEEATTDTMKVPEMAEINAKQGQEA